MSGVGASGFVVFWVVSARSAGAGRRTASAYDVLEDMGVGSFPVMGGCVFCGFGLVGGCGVRNGCRFDGSLGLPGSAVISTRRLP